HQRLEIRGLLLLGPEHRENLCIAGVGRGGAEHRRRPVRTAEDFVHQREAQLAVARPAEVRAEMAGPQPAAPDLVLQRTDRGAALRIGDVIRGAVTGEAIVERLDLALHEVEHPVELFLEFGVGLEIPHRYSPHRALLARASALATPAHSGSTTAGVSLR